VSLEGIGAPEARDHIEMVDRILAESQQRLCTGGEYFLAWGAGSAIVTALFQAHGNGLVPGVALWLVPVVLGLCVLFSLYRSRTTRAELARSSLVQREFFNVLWLTIGLTFVANVAAYRIFAGVASAAIWSIAEAIVLLYIGMHGNRRAQIAGILVVASLIVANFIGPDVTGYVLGAGMLFGYGGFGLGELLAHDSSR
jgi:hypothetical protein